MRDIDVEDAYRVVAAVYLLAIRDARKGCPRAKKWLRDVAPDRYGELMRVQPRRRRKN